MIISNYSSISLQNASVENTSAAKTITPDINSTHPSVSASSQATVDPAQSFEKHSAQAAAISQSSVSATDATTHQSSEKQRLENDAQISKDLAQRDREVKTHERIHASIGGAFASAPNFSYQKGPDGQLYAVEGDVRIDTSAVSGDPRATLEKAEVIIRAALSVPEPSVQDKQVAAQARVMAIEASAEIAKLDNPLEDRFQGHLDGALDNSSEKIIANDMFTASVKSPESLQKSAVYEDQVSKEDQEEESKDKKSVAEINAEATASSQAAAASLQEFNNRLNDINKTLHDINLRLVDAGVFEKLFPEGSLIDKKV